MSKEMKTLVIENEEYEVVDEKARPVKSVAEMKAMSNLVAGNIIKTIGYYSANDGGGATYLIREKQETDVEDLGAIHFINDTLVAELIIDTIINIKKFGAKGDNETDDTNAFKNAIAFMQNKEVYNLYIPNGIYLISETLNFVTLNKTFNVYGENKYNTQLKANATMNRFIQLSSGTSTSDRIAFKYHLHDLTINGGEYASIVVDGFLGVYSTIERVRFYSSKENAILYKTSGWVNRILNCTFRGLDGYTDDLGFSIQPITGILIAQNETVNNIVIRDNEFTRIQKAIDSVSDLNQVLIDGNTFDHCGKVLISKKRLHNLHISNNYLEGCGGNKTTKYTIDPIVYTQGDFSVELNSPFIFFEATTMGKQFKNSIVMDNNIFASCVYEHLVAISNPLKFEFKNNSIFGFDYQTNTILYDKIIYYFGCGGDRHSNLVIEWDYPINTLIDYNINDSAYFYDYTIKKLKTQIQNMCRKGLIKPKVGSTELGGNEIVTINTETVLQTTLKLSNLDLKNANPIIGKCDNGTYQVGITQNVNDTWESVKNLNITVTDNIMYIPLKREKITSNDIRLVILGTETDVNLNIYSLDYIPNNIYQGSIPLI